MSFAKMYPEQRADKISQLLEFVSRVTPVPFVDEQTEFMMGNFFLVSSLSDWEGVADIFRDRVLKYRVMSVDTEDLGGSKKLEAMTRWFRLSLLLIGTPDGTCFLFDLQELREGAKRSKTYVAEDLRSVLPEMVIEMIERADVFKVGSSIGEDALKDFEDYQISPQNLFCTQYLHSGVESVMFDRSDNVNDAHGFGRIGYDLFGYSHKTSKESTFIQRYGKHGYTRWPAWRDVRNLCRWTRPLSMEAKTYVHRDASLPFALLSTVVKFCLETHRFSMEDVCSDLGHLFRKTLRPYEVDGRWISSKKGGHRAVTVLVGCGGFRESHVNNKTGEDALSRKALVEFLDPCVVALEVVEEDGEEVVGKGNEEVVEDEEQCQAAGVEPKPVLELDADGETGVLPAIGRPANDPVVSPEEVSEFRDERMDVDTLEDEDLYHRGSRQDRRRRAPGSVFGRIRKLWKEKNAYRRRPFLGRRCAFCGGTTHSKRNKERKPLCSHYREQLRSLVAGQEPPIACEYSLCPDRTSHKVAACMSLATRCRSCGLRGHDKEADCGGNNEEQVVSYLAAFEEVADQHPELELRKDKPEWGFFRIQEDFVVDYEALVSMGGWEGKKFVDMLTNLK